MSINVQQAVITAQQYFNSIQNMILSGTDKIELILIIFGFMDGNNYPSNSSKGSSKSSGKGKTNVPFIEPDKRGFLGFSSSVASELSA